MAKKTIISDFSALKGKVSFSQKSALTAVEAEIKQDCKESKRKAKKTIHHGNKPQRTSTSGTLTIDLHIEAIPGGRNIPKGQQLEFQMDTFKRAVRENLPRRGLKICFIHGLGDGILKAAIRKELDEVLALRCSYTVGDPAVTVVTIK